jgi:hypothetical protein
MRVVEEKTRAVVFRALILRECVFEVEFTLFSLWRPVHQDKTCYLGAVGCRFINSTWPYKIKFVQNPATLKTRQPKPLARHT